MNRELSVSHATGFEKNVAKAYLFLLTIRMISPFLFFQKFFHAGANNLDFLLHILGIILILIRMNGRIAFDKSSESRLLKSFGLLVLYLNFSSLMMACIMQLNYGNVGSDSAFDAISGMAVYYFQYVLVFFYNKEIFKMFTKKELEKILQAEIWFLLIIGYMQVAIMNGVGIISPLYDKADIFNVVLDSGRLAKLALTGTEGASAGGIIGVFVIPYLLSGVLYKEKCTSEIVQIVLWLPIIYFTNSSTAYLLVCSVIPAFLVLLLKKRNGRVSRRGVVILLMIFIIVSFVVVFWEPISEILPKDVVDQINYLLIEKVSDTDNGSTVSRTIPLITNWGAFKEYPILGVGNGCQGYFYTKYFPSRLLNNGYSEAMVFYRRAQQGIVNGAIFFPSILSGYGLIGLLLVLRYFLKSNKVLKEKSQKIGRFNYYYILSLLPILFYGFQGEFAGTYFVWFVLSIPYMIPDSEL